MRTLIIVSLIFFSAVPMVLAGSVPSGGRCPSGTSDCVSGLGCVNGICQNLSPTPANPGTSVTLINPLKGGASIESFLRSILAFVVRIGSIVVILMLVLVGYKFVTAQGEPGKISEARQMLLWTVVGALILLGAQAIATGIEKTVQALSTGG